MFTTIEVPIDKTGHLQALESGQTIRPWRKLLIPLEPGITHEPHCWRKLRWRKTGSSPKSMWHGHTCSRASRCAALPVLEPWPE
jgi:hypothetical protein